MIAKELKRHEIEVLLPWHVLGKLSRREADLVELALAADRELAGQYERVCLELAEVVQLNEMLGTPSPRVTEKLFAAIAAEEARTPRRRERSCEKLPHPEKDHRAFGTTDRPVE
jgi:hypothetical protein